MTTRMVRNTLAGAALCLALAPAGARAQSALSASESARYRAEATRDAMTMLGEWQNAWTRDDLRTLSRLYDPNALLRLPGQPAAVQGREAVEGALRARLATFGRMEVETLDVEVGDRLLYLLQRYTIAPADAAGPSALALSGNVTTVLERDASGWRIRAQTFEAPAAGSSAAAASPAATADSAGAPPR
ncbi:MAG: YybH family protein [Longimicrobiaceae bacterium]